MKKLTTQLSPATGVDISGEIQQAKMRYGIVGNAPALIGAVSRAVRVAPIDLSVLVTGESGTGKEFFPKIIHAYSHRKHARYIAVNCGAIPEGTIDSELFGHEKGSFTGAVATRKGYFEEADGGTIFLDEVAELPLTTQARLLRVLETGEFFKVGSSTAQKTNIRIVAATNVDLRQAIAHGRFREDLYYRLSTVQITVPPLRDRDNDITLLARKFASDFAERYMTPEISFSPAARQLLLRYPWPGNVRQLKNIIDQISLFEAGTEVSDTTLAQYLPPNTALPMMRADNDTTTDTHSYSREREMLFNLIFNLRSRIDRLQARLDGQNPDNHQLLPPITDTVEVFDIPHTSPDTDLPSRPSTLEDNERLTIEQALRNNDGRRKDAARDLNISERTLYRKIKEYGLE